LQVCDHTISQNQKNCVIVLICSLTSVCGLFDA
jgi:hypothetical protein